MRAIRGVISKCAAVILNIMPSAFRANILIRLINVSIRYDSPDRAIGFLLEVDNRLYELEGKAAIRYGNGIHPKHKHINYHMFFIKNINQGEHVLDIGCGNGLLTYDIAACVSDVRIIGVELNEVNIKFANEHYRHPNLRFICGNAMSDLPHECFDVIVLSNVLEHLEDRVNFLQRVIRQTSPKRLLLRVPMFERDWRVPLKKELGIDYRLDSTHHIEYTYEEFVEELRQAGLSITHIEFRWGEIWAVAVKDSMNIGI
ncbi:MAG: class I SAM-dependent methyltransferase [Deltaproteobacteria bacterium]|nr:class I SAM-dependent methyltransferase [Deltaproteobacteria bacterium]